MLVKRLFDFVFFFMSMIISFIFVIDPFRISRALGLPYTLGLVGGYGQEECRNTDISIILCKC